MLNQYWLQKGTILGKKNKCGNWTVSLCCRCSFRSIKQACVLECADEGGTEVKSTKQNGGGAGKKEAKRRNKTRPTKKQKLSRKKKPKKEEKEAGVEEPEYNIELNQSEPWWKGEHGGWGWLLELMELWCMWWVYVFVLLLTIFLLLNCNVSVFHY